MFGLPRKLFIRMALPANREAYHGLQTDSPGTQSKPEGDPLSSKSIRSKEKGANHFAPLGQETLRVTTSTSAGETPAGQPARCRRHTHLLANLRKRPG